MVLYLSPSHSSVSSPSLPPSLPPSLGWVYMYTCMDHGQYHWLCHTYSIKGQVAGRHKSVLLWVLGAAPEVLSSAGPRAFSTGPRAFSTGPWAPWSSTWVPSPGWGVCDLMWQLLSVFCFCFSCVCVCMCLCVWDFQPDTSLHRWSSLGIGSLVCW